MARRLLWIIVMCCSAVAAGWTQPAGQVDRDAHLIKVMGDATMYVMPDTARIRFTIQGEDKSLAVARQKAVQTTTAVLAALKKLNVPGLSLATERVSVTPLTRPQRIPGMPGEMPGMPATGIVASETVGYRVSSDIATTLRSETADFAGRVAAIIDTAIGAGATSLYGPSFSRSERADVELQALEKATKRAVALANALAEGLGVRVSGYASLSMYPETEAMERIGYLSRGEESYDTGGKPPKGGGAPTPIEVAAQPIQCVVWLTATFDHK